MIMAVSAVFLLASALDALCLGLRNRLLPNNTCIKRCIKTHRAFEPALSCNLNNTAYFPSPQFYEIYS